MIDIENLRLSIDGKEILRGIDLHLQPGDVYGLLGPNGAGKSTTLFALLGLCAYASGRVVVLGGDPAQDAASIRRYVGVMPEKAGFYNWMSATAYLKWYARLYGCAQDDRGRARLLEKVGLGTEAHRRIGTFSRGMKQRLAVARALMPNPKLLILDEPTNGLDPKGRRRIHDLLVEFAAVGKAGVLLCTHLLDDVDRLCNRIGIISNGFTRFEGSLSGLMGEQERRRHYRLRLEAAPDADNLPTGVTVLGPEGGWWRVQLRDRATEAPSAIWGALWHRGWRILEIRAEALSLEQIYMRHTGQEHAYAKEVAK
jgi:ABC-2 type transport system ATP-binding protein